MAEKKVNYPQELTDIIVAAYVQCNTDKERADCLENLSAEHGREIRSLRAKLVKEKVYVKPTPKTKTGAPIERKSKIVEDIASALGVTSEQLPQLEKATVVALKLIRGTLERAAKLANRVSELEEKNQA